MLFSPIWMQLLLDYGVPVNVLGLVDIVVLKILKVGVKKEKKNSG